MRPLPHLPAGRWYEDLHARVIKSAWVGRRRVCPWHGQAYRRRHERRRNRHLRSRRRGRPPAVTTSGWSCAWRRTYPSSFSSRSA